MSLNAKQWEMLLKPLDPARIQKLQGQSHLEAWDVRRWLIRIFGVGGWDFEVVSCDLVREIEGPYVDKKTGEIDSSKLRYTVVYRVLGRLVVRDPEGSTLARYEDGAIGDAVNQPSLGDAHDMALKTALSQALKRCAVNLGDQFGLSLYNHGRPEGVVGRSIPALPLLAAAEEPEGGEAA